METKNSAVEVPLGDIIDREALAAMIDHTLLKPYATPDDIARLCEEAGKYKFASVCVHPVYVQQAARLLVDSAVKVCSVAGFPLGTNLTIVKAEETRTAVELGAKEIDMVINIGALKAGDYRLVEEDIAAVVRAAGGCTVKVIIETCYLNEDEKIKACEISKKAGAHFVKTSTGLGTAGATVEDVLLMRRVVGDDMGVKAAGGIRTYADAVAMIRAGANRIGSASGVAIVDLKL